MANQCPKCQTENPPDSKFCRECATPLPSSTGSLLSKTDTLLIPREGLASGAVFAGRYQVIEELGQGGMGKIYKVFDRVTQSKVALKLIKAEIAADESAVERFRNELNVARDISHKYICRVYDLGREAGAYFITMEYVSGEDLADLIRRTKRLDVATAVSIAKQVSEGMAEAHRLGVIHRDLKPGNIMIDRDGDVKIMDFGIARSLRTKGLTGPGEVVGSPEYMSPEQFEGQDLDPRTDLYSLSVILYEMVTGRVPFEGETPFVVGRKHKTEPPENPKTLNPQIPDDLSRLILKGLEKDRERRYPSAAEFLSDLAKIEQGLPVTARVLAKKKTPRPSRMITVNFTRPKLILGTAGVAAVALGAGLLILFSARRTTQPSVLPSHRQLTFTGEAAFPAISPDGKSFAFVTGRRDSGFRGSVQDLVGGPAIDVFSGSEYFDLVWTPDGSEITVLSRDGVFLIPRLGGSPRRLEDFDSVTWSPDGSRYAGSKRGSRAVVLVEKSSGEATSVDLSDPVMFILGIDWSPTGGRLAVLTVNTGNKYSLWTVKTDGGQINRVLEDDAFLSSPRWAPDGDALFYLRGRASRELMTEIWRLPLSGETERPAKAPSLVFSGIPMGGHFSLSADGEKLLYTRESQFTNLWAAKIESSGKDRTVRTRPLSTGTSVHEDVSLSPDGKRIAFSKGDGMTMNIFVMPVEGGSPVQLTFFNSRTSSPAWSPDGTEIAFGSSEGGVSRVWKVSAQGGRPHQFARSELSESHHVLWAPRSRILYQKMGNRNYQDLDPATEEERPLVKNESVGWLFADTYSPDGKKLAAFWNRQPTKGLWLISLEDGSETFTGVEGDATPIGWSADGKWLYAVRDNDFLRIEAGSLRTEPLPTIAFTIEGEPHHMPLEDGTKIYVNRKTQSDVWVIENFGRLVK